MATAKKVEVTFIKSPTGTFGLAYSAGDSAKFEKKQADELIKSGFAVKKTAAKADTK